MLPPGIAADVLPTAERAELRVMLPAAQTAAHVRVGSCSCDLVRPRQVDSREDERHLRLRYSKLALPRDRIIGELERHRRDAAPSEPPGGWREAFAGFVAEHARNAGPTLYHLAFQPGGRDADRRDADRRDAGSTQALTRTVADVLANPSWLEEGPPVVVVR